MAGKKLYLKDPKLFIHSAHHTAYTGAGQRNPDSGVQEGLASQVFVRGAVRDERGRVCEVDGQHAQRFLDAGIASEQRPRTRRDEDEE